MAEEVARQSRDDLRITTKAPVKSVLISTSSVKIVDNHQERTLLKQMNLTKLF